MRPCEVCHRGGIYCDCLTCLRCMGSGTICGALLCACDDESGCDSERKCPDCTRGKILRTHGRRPLPAAWQAESEAGR